MKGLVLGVVLLALVGCQPDPNLLNDVIWDCSNVKGAERQTMILWETECREKFTHGCNKSTRETFCKSTLRKDLANSSINQTSIVNDVISEAAPAQGDQTQERKVPND